jgi:cystathionine beta-synthase
MLTAFQRMRVADVSQVPVMVDGAAVGIVDEYDLLMAMHGDPNRFRDPVKTAMTTKLKTISPEASLPELRTILDQGLVALVMEDGEFVGLITPTDLLNHLRRKL